MLGALDPLSRRPQRILIVGVTGVGKTTLAARLSEVLGLPHTELDSLYHGANWSYRESFLPEVEALAATNGWITEWQFSSARPILLARADLLVWLDLSLRVSLARLIRRTVVRRLRRQQLESGNREPPLWHFFTGRDHVLAWAVSTHRRNRRTVPALQGSNPQVAIVRLRSQREVDAWLAGPVTRSRNQRSDPIRRGAPRGRPSPSSPD